MTTTATARDTELVLEWLAGDMPWGVLEDYLKDRGVLPEVRPEPRRQVLPRVRWGIRRDFPAILACHPEFPRFDERWLVGQCGRADTILRVVTDVSRATDAPPDEPVGWVTYRLLSDRLHVAALAVRPDFRRLGLASILLSNLTRTGRTLLTADVRADDLPALLLFGRAGFRLHTRHGRHAALRLRVRQGD